MKPSAIRRRNPPKQHHSEHGVTIALVAIALVGIMAMAALSIDAVTLYLANAEAQRSADAGALAAARVLSISGMTGDPQNTGGYWQAACTLATQVAQSVSNQNLIGGTVANSVSVTFPNDPNGDCTDGSGTSTVFGLNPIVQVKVQRNSLPTFFARIWGKKGANVSATATAEAYNPSSSGDYTASMVPVQPRCVKPWIVGNGPFPGNAFVDLPEGAINAPPPGIRLNRAGTGGVIGHQIILTAACAGVACANVQGSSLAKGSYIPALVQGTPLSIPSCAKSSVYQEAIGGCDQTTIYACGTVNGATADLTFNPGGASGDTSTAAQCLINNSTGSDVLNTAGFPFRIEAGLGNPLVAKGIVNTSDVVTASNNILTVPLMDYSVIAASNNPSVTIVGFLQVFIDGVQPNGNPRVTILNVSGCTNSASTSGVTGSSPVPVRLINYP